MARFSTVISALADPTRRDIFERLAVTPQSVGALAQDLPISRPAVSQHLRMLKEAGLVTDQARGTRRIYHIDPAGLGALRQWLDRFWDRSLAAFQAEADKDQKDPDKEEKAE